MRKKILLFLVLASCAPLLFVWLPRSQALIFHSWEGRTGPLPEKFVWQSIAHKLPFVRGAFAEPGSYYQVTISGKVSELRLHGVNFSSLDDLPGIESFTSLEILDLSDIPLQGSLDLSAFVSLEELHLRGGNLSAIRGLDRLSHLRVLDARACGIRDQTQIINLQALRALRVLNLSDNPLEHSFDLSGLSALEEVHLRNTQLNEIANLAGLGRLTTLDLKGSPIKQLYDIGNANTVDLSDTQITDLSPLARARFLELLRLEGMDLSRLSGIEQLTRIKGLGLKRCKGVDPHRIALLTQLEALWLHQSDITDLRPLASLKQLQWLSIAGTQTHTLAGIEGMVRLSSLDIRGTPLAPGELDRLPNKSALVLYGKDYQGIRDERELILAMFSSPTKRLGLNAFFVLLLLGLLLTLPLRKSWRRHWLVVTRQIVRRVIAGGLYILILLALAIFTAHIPGNTLTRWVTIAAILSLLVKPILSILLESRL